MKKADQKFLTIVTSKHKLFDLHIKETFKYRDLIALFVKRDFTALYKQTILGPLWAIIQPLFTTIVFTLVFGSLAKLTNLDIDGDFIVPSFLFYLCGNIIWSYFSQTLTAVSNTFITNSATMGKVYYPRLVAPIATALSQLIPFCIQFILFLIIWLVVIFGGSTSLHFSFNLLLLPLVFLQLIILSVSFGIIISSLTTKYRDLVHAVGFGLQLWQFASPVAYGLSLVPDNYLSLYLLNPVCQIITTFRYAVFGFGYFNLGYYLISWAVTLCLLFIGLLLFSKIERTFADTI